MNHRARRVRSGVILFYLFSLSPAVLLLRSDAMGQTLQESGATSDDGTSRELTQIYERLFHDNGADLSLDERIKLINIAFSTTTTQRMAENICDLITISLIRSSAADRHAIGRDTEMQCEEVFSSKARSERLRALAVMIQVLRFDDAKMGGEIEMKWWKKLVKSPENLQLTLLTALPLVPASGKESEEERKKRLCALFAEAKTEQVKQAVVSCVSISVQMHTFQPHEGVDVYRAIVRTNRTSPEVMESMLTQIGHWFYVLRTESNSDFRMPDKPKSQLE